MLSQKSRLLSEMFPYDIENKKNGELRKGLKEYEFFLEALSEAGTHFQNGHLERFDSLVGENACQIRAVKIAIIAAKAAIDMELLINKVYEVQVKLAVLLDDRKLAQLMISNRELAEVLETENLDIHLTNEQMFLFQSFLLCEMKELEVVTNFIKSLTYKDKSVPKKLSRFSNNVSANFTNGVANKARKQIAKTSVNFVRQIAAELQDTSLIKMTSGDFTLEHNSLPCLPMFWTYKTLLKTAQNKFVPIVVHAQFVTKQNEGYTIVEEDLLYFKPTQDSNGINYILTSSENLDSEKPSCVIQGVVCINTTSKTFDKAEWKSRMTNHSIIDIILAGAADHRQYPNEKNDASLVDAEYENYRSLAKNLGFSLENPNTFFINHVFSMQIGRTSRLIMSA